MKLVMAIKFIMLLVLVAGEVCVNVATSNRKMKVAPQPEAVGSAVAASASTEEEMKNHHTIPRESWDSSQDEDEDGISAGSRG